MTETFSILKMQMEKNRGGMDRICRAGRGPGYFLAFTATSGAVRATVNLRLS
jgi:hypothetical protein